MATKKDFQELTKYLTMDNDCPLCGLAWAACNGKCIEHETLYGIQGPFHTDFNDDCFECLGELNIRSNNKFPT